MRRAGRTFAYARVSAAAQATEGTSLEGQRDRFERYRDREGLEAVDIRVEVESASKRAIERRVELRRLLEDVRPGDTILVCKVDRWSRDISYAVDSVRGLVAKGVRWLSLDEGIDATTPQGDSTLGIMAWAADQEHKRIRERTVGRRMELLAEGYWCHGARPPFGYRRSAGPDKLAHLVLEVVPEDAAVMVELYRRCVRGSSVADITAWLEDTQEGRGWSGSLVKAMLCSRVYLGEIKTPAGWVKGKHPAIVPLELWSRAQESKRSRDKGGRKPSETSRTASWLVRPSFARCGACGVPLRSAYGRHPEHTYLACRDSCGAPWARVREVDAAVEGMVLERLRGLRAELAAPPPTPLAPAKLRDFAAERRRLEAALERAQRLAVDGDLDAAALRRERTRVASALERLERDQADAARATEAASPEARRALLADVRKLERLWRRATVSDRRATLEDLAEHVTVAAGEPPVVAWKSAAALAIEGGDV